MGPRSSSAGAWEDVGPEEETGVGGDPGGMSVPDGSGPLAVSITGEDWLQAICPFLRAIDGSWRSAGPVREHRCWATEPPSELPVLTQQRLCLVRDHDGCERFRHARELRSAQFVRERPVGQAPVAPVAAGAGEASTMDPRARLAEVAGTVLALPRIALAGIGLLGAAGLVFVALILSGGGPSPSPSVGTSQEARPTSRRPTPSPTLQSTLPPGSREYRIREGDTLRSIAERFGVTVRQIRSVNDLGDPPRLEPGTVILIPAP